MKLLPINNFQKNKTTFNNSKKTTEEKKVNVNIDTLKKINKDNEDIKKTLYLLGAFILGSSVVWWHRTGITRIKNISSSSPLKNRRTLYSGSIELEIKNLSNDKNVKSLDELSGLEKIKEFFEEYQTILNNPEAKKEHNIQNYSSLLLWGVPGTGKTSAAKGIAKKLNADYIQIDKELFDSMFISEGPQRLAEVIDQIEAHAKKNPKKPIVVFMDEIDGTISIDIGFSARHSEDLTNTLKKGITYLEENCDNVIFIGATNKDPNGIKSDNIRVKLNPAILSRFKYQIEIDLPTKDAIKDAWMKLMKTASGKEKFSTKESEVIAQHFEKLGMSYRDITNIANKLNRQDAVEFCQKGNYNSKENLINILLNDEKIGYDPVKKETLSKEILLKIIGDLKENLK